MLFVNSVSSIVFISIEIMFFCSIIWYLIVLEALIPPLPCHGLEPQRITTINLGIPSPYFMKFFPILCYEQLFIQADFSNYFFNRGIPINESFETCLRAVQILPESFFP